MDDEGFDPQWLRGVLDLCVLAVLVDEPRYGYDLARRLGDEGLPPIKGGTLYPLLRRLESSGLVTSQWRPGEHGPGRKYYALTPAGHAHLTGRAPRWQAFARSTAQLMERREDAAAIALSR